MLNLKHRIDRPEIMDTEKLTLPVMRQALKFLTFTNRYCGGTSILLRYFNLWSKFWDKNVPVRILDVGTGGADIPMALAAWGRQRGVKIEITGIDLVPEVVALARANTAMFKEIKILQQDLFRRRHQPGQFDYVIASLFLHHMPPAMTERTLQTFDALATRGIIVSDLHRTLPGYLSVTAASYLTGNHVVRHDGPLSVRRAFRPRELEQLAGQAGISYLRARPEPWFRVSLAGEKIHAA